MRHLDVVAPRSVSLEGTTATLVDVLGAGRILAVTATTTGFEEALVLAAKGLAPFYRVEMTLPNGVTARAGGPGVELVSTAGAVVTVEAGVDPAWANAAARVAPITVDPSFSTSTTDDTWVQTSLTSSRWAGSDLRVGTTNGGADVARSMLRFDVAGIVGNANVVTEAHLGLTALESASCTPTAVGVVSTTSFASPGPGLGLAAGFDAATVWSNQPAADAVGVVSRPRSPGPARASASPPCPADSPGRLRPHRGLLHGRQR